MHKICNKRMAQVHGMTVEEWENTPTFLNDLIVEEDLQMYARNYYHHVAGLRHPVTFRFRGLHKDDSTFAAETDMIPLCWNGHPVAYHFMRRFPARVKEGNVVSETDDENGLWVEVLISLKNSCSRATLLRLAYDLIARRGRVRPAALLE